MPKPVVSLMQLTGLLQGIVTNLLTELGHLGGGEDDLRILSNSQDPIVKRVAQTILMSLEKYDPPTLHKNWPEICQALRLGKPDPAIVWANALARPASRGGRRLAWTFQEFWSFREVHGPVPWSLLQQEAERGGQEQDSPNGKQMMVLFGAIEKFNLPYQEFFMPPVADYMMRRYVDNGTAEVLPDSIPEQIDVGKTVEWRGAEWIVVENRYGFGDDNLCIVPAECIAMDL